MADINAQKSPLIQRVQHTLFIALILILLGFLTRPLESFAWKSVKAGQPEIKLEGIEDALGQGLVIGVLGGFRAIIADFLWIRNNTLWENRERVKLDSMIRLVTTIDPRPAFFWLNGARMIAYDVPNWRVQEEGGYFEVPEARQQQIDLEQAEQAFVLLESAREFHPEKAKFYLETGQIYLNRLKDNKNAAKWFMLALEKSDAPNFAARTYAELLRREGKYKEAYEFLKNLYHDFADKPIEQRSVVLGRIRELEVTLKIPLWKRFDPEGSVIGKPDETSLDQKAYLLEQTFETEFTPDNKQ